MWLSSISCRNIRKPKTMTKRTIVMSVDVATLAMKISAAVRIRCAWLLAPHPLDRLIDGDEEDQMRRRRDGVVRDRGIDDVEAARTRWRRRA